MADEDDGPEQPQPAGLPAWVMTFADLMSLLMCFFVLLLSFSQMDLSKFKKVAGSMENAFGVQREIVAYEIPKGTSVIAQEFSPGKPNPTPINEIRQVTIEELRQTLEFDEERTKGITKEKNSEDDKKDDKEAASKSDSPDEKTEAMAESIAEAMAQEILQGNIEVEAYGQRIIVRIMENGSFESGLAELRPQFMPIVNKLRLIVSQIPGDVQVGGHTDNIPIFNSQFPSNWALSAARAVAVAHALMNTDQIDPQRISVAGFGDTRPLFPNNSSENRKRNRRVEILLIQGDRPTYLKLKDVELNKEGKGNEVKRDRVSKPFELQNIEGDVPPADKLDLPTGYQQRKIKSMDDMIRDWKPYESKL